jgi:L,D-peptidoglycan transpeptidase YkuD (ErfK/YbiS/YcfS/YnhG family)
MKVPALAILATAGALSTFGSAAQAVEPIAPAPSPPPVAEHGRQLIVVSAATYGLTRATLKAYELTAGHRRLAFGPWTARTGAHGIAPAGQKREGDDRTPSGSFGLQFMFGVSPNPGVRYPYRRVRSYDVWDDDPRSPLYNEWVDDRAQNPGVSPELMDVTPAYEYGAVIAYNLARTPDFGSAIFLHVNVAGAGPTAGCVSLPRGELLELLRWLDPSQSPMIEMGVGAGRASQR